jgi:hypothetical protein
MSNIKQELEKYIAQQILEQNHVFFCNLGRIKHAMWTSVRVVGAYLVSVMLRQAYREMDARLSHAFTESNINFVLADWWSDRMHTCILDKVVPVNKMVMVGVKMKDMTTMSVTLAVQIKARSKRQIHFEAVYDRETNDAAAMCQVPGTPAFVCGHSSMELYYLRHCRLENWFRIDIP